MVTCRGEANISQVTGQVLEKCKQLDTHHTGKVCHMTPTTQARYIILSPIVA